MLPRYARPPPHSTVAAPQCAKCRYDLKHDCKFAYATALEELAAALGLAERLGSSAEASS